MRLLAVGSWAWARLTSMYLSVLWYVVAIFLPSITGVVPTDCWISQLPCAMCGMSLNTLLRSPSVPL